MKLKSVITAAVVAAASACTLLTGCEPNDAVIVAAANTAGNLALSAWFAIDDPDDDVKHTLKEVVSMVEKGAGAIGEGGSYVDALTPAIQGFIASRDDLTPAQKNLINTGSMVLLGALDSFIASNPELKDNAERASKVVAAFCSGCLTAIARTNDENCCTPLKKAHAAISMQYDVQAKAFVAAPAK